MSIAAQPLVPGFPCPECGARLVATIQTLLGGDPLRCGQCGLELTLDPQRSAGAMDALRKLNEELERAKESVERK